MEDDETLGFGAAAAAVSAPKAPAALAIPSSQGLFYLS